MYLRFYIGDLTSNFVNKFDNTLLDVTTINILESFNYQTGYKIIDKKPAKINNDYIETEKGSEYWIDCWYILEWVNDKDPENIKVFGRTKPIVPEKILDIVDKIRDWFGDVDLENPAFSDQEYIQAIRFALKQYKGEKSLSTINEDDVIPITILVRIEFCYILAYDHAKYYALSAPSVNLDKSQIMQHYLQVARELEEHYKNISRRLSLEFGGQNDNNIITTFPSPDIVVPLRYDHYLGGMVNYGAMSPTQIQILKRKKNFFKN